MTCFGKASSHINVSDDTDILFKELQPGKELLCIVFTVFGILIFFNEERLLKVEFSIEVIDGGRSISVSAMHFEKAYCPIETTESGIIIFDNKKQLEKAKSSIIVTEEGMTTLFKDTHSLKADFLIIVTEGGI